MDTEILRKKYTLWSNIIDLRSRGLNITRTAKRLGVSRDTVKRLQSLSSDELFRKY
ncbi:helix-turn-helix domain-containing protein, partial [Bacteroides fragilis]